MIDFEVSLNLELSTINKKTIMLAISPTTEAREKVNNRPRKIITRSGNLNNCNDLEFVCRKNTSQKLSI